MGKSITDARDEAPFKTRDDLLNRAKIGQSGVQTLADYGLLEGMPESSQIDLFSLIDGG